LTDNSAVKISTVIPNATTEVSSNVAAPIAPLAKEHSSTTATKKRMKKANREARKAGLTALGESAKSLVQSLPAVPLSTILPSAAVSPAPGAVQNSTPDSRGDCFPVAVPDRLTDRFSSVPEAPNTKSESVLDIDNINVRTGYDHYYTGCS
jgi:hypothetical protein